MTSTSTDWLARAHEFGSIIQKYRDEAEQARQMPRPLFEALRDAGFFRLWLPRRCGGPEVDMRTLIRVVEELACLDGAAGWNVMISAVGSAFAAYLPEETARELFAPAHTVQCLQLRDRRLLPLGRRTANALNARCGECDGTSPRFMRSHCGVGCWRDNGKRLVLYPRHGLTTSCASRVYETGRRTSETDFASGA